MVEPEKIEAEFVASVRLYAERKEMVRCQMCDKLFIDFDNVCAIEQSDEEEGWMLVHDGVCKEKAEYERAEYNEDFSLWEEDNDV